MTINHYDRADVDRILAAYKALFPDTPGDLTRYWDFARERDWSCLTSNFHDASFEQFQALHEQTKAINQTVGITGVEKGEKHPERWSGATRNCKPILVVHLNPDKMIAKESNPEEVYQELKLVA